jgi:hypothetical protein
MEASASQKALVCIYKTSVRHKLEEDNQIRLRPDTITD